MTVFMLDIMFILLSFVAGLIIVLGIPFVIMVCALNTRNAVKEENFLLAALFFYTAVIMLFAECTIIIAIIEGLLYV